MFVLVVLATGLLFAFSLWYHHIKKKYEDIDKLPGPPVKGFSGNASEFGNNTIDSFYNSQRLIKQYGRLLRIWQGPFRVNLFVTDPDLVEFFLSSNVHIKKSEGYDLYIPWLGQGLINSTGETWKKHRRILTPAFHFKILEQFSDVFHSNFKVLIKKLREVEGKAIDIYPVITLYSMDVLCESSMGANYKCQEGGDNTYIESVKTFLNIYMVRFFSILKRYDFFLWFTEDYNKLYDAINAMHGITNKVVQKRRMDRLNKTVDEDQTNEVGIKKKKVFIDILLDDPTMTDEEVRWEADTFLFAGHDTVSTTIAFSIYELAKHFDMQQKILEEIHEIVGEDRNEEITYSKLKEMNYLDRVIKEVLRVYPTVPLYERQLTQDVEIKGVKIPRGTTISFHPYSQHRDPELFPDPEKFDPDRFLLENVMSRHKFAYIPFSAGPRNCIGQKYAMMNVKTVVANFVRNFEIHPPDEPHNLVLENDAVMKSSNGLPVKLIYRK